MASNISSLQNLSSGGAIGGSVGVNQTGGTAGNTSGSVKIGGGHANGAAAQSSEKPFDQVWNEIQSKYGGKEEKMREAKKSLGKDDFLKIMLTQLSHQDPTKPMEADKMATEMAQMTSVEQLQNVNKAIENLANKSTALDKLTMAGLIGKSVTIDRNRFPHQQDSRETLNFTLPEDAKSVKATIVAESGETIFEKDLGVQKAGENSFLWDGKKLNTIPAKAGNYTLHIEARGVNEKPIIPTTQVKTQVVGVNFEGSDAVLLCGNPQKPEKVALRAVIKIDGGAGMGGFPVAQPGAPGKPAMGGSFFSFTPGVGSKPLDPNALAPAARSAMEKLARGGTAEGAEKAAHGIPTEDAEDAAAVGAEMDKAPRAPEGQQPGNGSKNISQIPGLQSAMNSAMRQMGQAQEQDSKEKGFPSGLND